jgi:shikimate kinase
MHIYLIGYRGSGKSTVGRLLAQRLGRPQVDSDDLIEAESGMSIKDIFATKGEPWFRDLEAKIVAEISARAQPTIVALGGGAILRESTQTILKATGKCVWLSASAEHLFERIQSDQATRLRRPNLSESGGFTEVAEILARRTPIYASLSDFTVVVEGKTPDEVCDEISDYINSANAER